MKCTLSTIVIYDKHQVVREDLETLRRESEELKRQAAESAAALETATKDLVGERNGRAAAERALAACSQRASLSEAEARSFAAKAKGRLAQWSGCRLHYNRCRCRLAYLRGQ